MSFRTRLLYLGLSCVGMGLILPVEGQEIVSEPMRQLGYGRLTSLACAPRREDFFDRQCRRSSAVVGPRERPGDPTLPGPYRRCGCRGVFPDGARVLTGSADDTARLWDTATGQELRRLQHPSQVNAVAFSPEGNRMLTGDGLNNMYSTESGYARLWDLDSGEEIERIFHSYPVTSVAFAPDGARVLTASRDEKHDATARLWDLSTGRVVQCFRHPGEVYSVAFSPDGTRILTGHDDSTARLWDTATGRELQLFLDKTNIDVAFVGFASDGTQVLTGHGDHTVRLWDVTTGQELRRFDDHTNAIFFATFAPDGARVLTVEEGNGGNTARLWEIGDAVAVRDWMIH